MWEIGLMTGIAASYAKHAESRRRAAESLALMEAQTAMLSNRVPGSVPSDLYAQLMSTQRNLLGGSNTGTHFTATGIGRLNGSSLVRCAYCRRERHAVLRTKRCEGCGAQEVV